jgi:hypothetical protein
MSGVVLFERENSRRRDSREVLEIGKDCNRHFSIAKVSIQHIHEGLVGVERII